MAKNLIASARVHDIAARIRGVASRVIEPENDKAEAMEQVRTMADELRNTREGLMVDIARMAASEQWTKAEITQACKAAVKSNAPKEEKTSGDKAMASFVSELKNVADPQIASRFLTIMDLRDQAWEAEQEAYKSAEKGDKSSVAMPCKKLWSRKYHMLGAMVRAILNDGEDFTTVDDIVDYAVANDPDLNADKVEQRLKKIVEDLQGIYADFKHGDLNVVVEYLQEITAADLIRAKQAAAQPGTEPGAPPASAPVVVSKAAPRDVAAPAAPRPLADLDTIDELLNDTSPMLIAAE
jgi:hypothetical protein